MCGFVFFLSSMHVIIFIPKRERSRAGEREVKKKREYKEKNLIKKNKESRAISECAL